jgi:hypothetical protein
MNVKVFCPCGAKFRFEVEPINGRMPAAIKCPTCGGDATELADAVIAQQLASPQPVALSATVISEAPAAPPAMTPPPISAPRVAVARSAPVETPATEGVQPSAPAATCPKHRGEMAAAECFVCHKPICHKCMQQFGYLCSSYCKGQAEARKMKVPVFEGQIFQKRAAEGRSQGRWMTIGVLAATLLFGLYIWYWFFGSRPKQAYRIETLASVPFLYADWISDDKFFGVTPARVALFNAKDGAQIWALDLPKGEINSSKSKGDHGGEDDWYFDFKPKVAVVSKDIWVGLPTRVLRLEGNTGKKKAEIILPQRASDYRLSESHLLAVSRNETNDSKLLTRISFADGQMQSVATPASSGARRLIATVRPMKGLANTSLKNYKPEDEEFTEYNSISYGRDPDFVFTSPNVAHVTRQLVEERIQVQSSAKKKSGPLIIDSGNARASQGIAAAEEYFNQNAPDEKIDQSLYQVTVDRYFGGGPQWTGQIAGRPHFYSQKTVDLLVGGTTLIVLNKNNQKLWEAKLTYPVSPDLSDNDENGPALEVSNRLLFYDQGVLTAFDLKKGDVQWRVNAVFISSLTLDGTGNVYLSATTAGPENIRYTQQARFNDKVYPMIFKVELKSGKVLWQSPRTGSNCQVSGDYVYTSDSQISGLDMMKSAMGGDGGTPVHWRLHRLNPSSGSEKWEWYRKGAPEAVRVREKQILLHFKNGLRLLRYL